MNQKGCILAPSPDEYPSREGPNTKLPLGRGKGSPTPGPSTGAAGGEGGRRGAPRGTPPPEESMTPAESQQVSEQEEVKRKPLRKRRTTENLSEPILGLEKRGKCMTTPLPPNRKSGQKMEPSLLPLPRRDRSRLQCSSRCFHTLC